jgi:hypothetical protein
MIVLMLGLQGASFAQVISIPRYRSPISPPETLSLSFPGMHYDPVDTPLLWTRTGEIVIAHAEHYSSGDVMSATCGGSGIFARALQRGTARSLFAGKSIHCAQRWFAPPPYRGRRFSLRLGSIMESR